MHRPALALVATALVLTAAPARDRCRPATPLRRDGRLLQRGLGGAAARPGGTAAVPALDPQLPARHRLPGRRAAARRHLRRCRDRRLLRGAVRRRRAAARRAHPAHPAGDDDHRRQRPGRVHRRDRRSAAPPALPTAGAGEPVPGRVRPLVRPHDPPADRTRPGEGAGAVHGRAPRAEVAILGYPWIVPRGDGLLRPDAGRRGRRPLPAQHPAGAQRRRGAGGRRPPARRTSTSAGSPTATTPARTSACAGSSRCCRAPTRSWSTPTRSASGGWPGGTIRVLDLPVASGGGTAPAVARATGSGSQRRSPGVAPAWSSGPNDWWSAPGGPTTQRTPCASTATRTSPGG